MQLDFFFTYIQDKYKIYAVERQVIQCNLVLITIKVIININYDGACVNLEFQKMYTNTKLCQNTDSSYRTTPGLTIFKFVQNQFQLLKKFEIQKNQSYRRQSYKSSTVFMVCKTTINSELLKNNQSSYYGSRLKSCQCLSTGRTGAASALPQ